MKSLSRMAAALAIVMMCAASSSAYEFHLLSGMVIRGELAGFDGAAFHIKTDFGAVLVETSKLDYIIVEESDGQAAAGRLEPGMMVMGAETADAVPGGGQAEAAPPPPPPGPDVEIIRGVDRERASLEETEGDGGEDATSALEGEAPEPPEPPDPVDDWSLGIDDDSLYPGAFSGRSVTAPPVR